MPPKRINSMPRRRTKTASPNLCFIGSGNHPHTKYTEGTAASLAEQRSATSLSPWSHFLCGKCGWWHVGHTPASGVMVERKVVFA